MIISSRLYRLLIVSIFYLSALGLGGCSADKARLGVCSGQEAIATSQPEVEQVDSGSKQFINWAGYISDQIGCISGAVLGGIFGACIDIAYVSCNGGKIDPRVPKMATTYNLASYSSKFFRAGGNYACTGLATGLVWLTPHVVKSTQWIACTSCNGIKCLCASIYDYYIQEADTSNDHQDNQESNIFTYDEYEVDSEDDSDPFIAYEVRKRDNPEPVAVLKDKDHDSNHDSDYDSDYGSGDEVDGEVYFDPQK